MTVYYESHDLARELGLTPAAIRLRVLCGSLVPDARTNRGWLFLPSTVCDLALREELARRHRTAHPTHARQLVLF